MREFVALSLIVQGDRYLMKLILIGGKVISPNLQNFRYKPLSWPAFDLHDYVQRVSYVRFDRTIGHFYTALQHACRETRNPLASGVGMDRRDRAAVTRVKELQEVECFPAANLAQNDSVWPVSQGCFQKVTDRHGGDAA